MEELPRATNRVGDWKVSGRVVHVSAATLLKQNDGAVALGVTVKVEGIAQADGSLNATEIETKFAEDSERREISLRGTVEALPAAATQLGDWRVSGRTIHVTNKTRLIREYGLAVVGSTVEVEGYLQTDNSIDTKKVEVESQPSAPVRNTPGYCRFFGIIKTLPVTTGWIGEWNVGGHKLNVVAATTIVQERGPIAVGALVEVKGQQKADGSIDATKIEVKGTITGGAGVTFIEIVGTITALPTTSNLIGDWKVDGRTVRVTASTFIKREHGAAAVGVLVEAKGQLQADGSIDATVIEVKRSSNFTSLNRLTSVNAGGYQAESSAEAIIASFGSNLAAATVSATSLPLPTNLGGVSVLVDGKPAPLFFVSATQVNYLVPASTSLGTAKVEVVRGAQVLAQGAISLPGVSPSFFTANSDSKGVPAGYITRVKADNSLSNEAINRYDAAQRKFVATPIVKKSGETLFLILYGTGFRTAPDSDGKAANGVAENVEVTIGGVKAEVAYAGLSGYVGVEQLNIKLPSDVVAGASITVLVKVNDGQGKVLRANETTIAIQ